MVFHAAWQLLVSGLKAYFSDFWNALDWVDIGIFCYVISIRKTGPAPARSTTGPGSPRPHLHWDWALSRHICIGTRLAMPYLHPTGLAPCRIGCGQLMQTASCEIASVVCGAQLGWVRRTDGSAGLQWYLRLSEIGISLHTVRSHVALIRT
jgi:hypothetical protein